MFIYFSQQRPNTLYQELSFHDDGLGEVEEGMDITGKIALVMCLVWPYI